MTAPKNRLCLSMVARSVYDPGRSRPMKTLIRLCACLCFAAAAAYAAAPGDFFAVRALSGPAPAGEPRLADARLDDAVFADTRPGFPDLRVFDAAGRELPRLVDPLYTVVERVSRATVLAQTVDLRELVGNRIEARFDLAPDAPFADGLDVRTPLDDFLRTVRVSGSEDGRFWKTLAEADIYDYSRYIDFRRTEIALPANACRHFSVEISNASEERIQPLVQLVQANGQDQSRAFEIVQTPFRMSGVTFFRHVAAQADDEPVLREWPPAAMSVSFRNDSKTTEIVLDTRRAPITRLDLETPTRNFNRIATLQIPALSKGRKVWRTVADAIVTRIDVAGFTTNRLSVAFPEQRAEQLRLVIQNADAPPIEIAAVRAYGPVYRLLWLAEPGGAYRLAYGHDTVAAPTYDLLSIRAALDRRIAADLWQIAPPEVNRAREKITVPFFSRPVVFGTLFTVAALALLGLLAVAIHKTTP